MKYLLLIPDGMADWEVEELDSRTPLEVAETENMDFIASEGSCGMAKQFLTALNREVTLQTSPFWELT